MNIWNPKEAGVAKKGSAGSVGVAIDRDRSSQHALKWAIDNLLERGQTVMLIHVKLKSGSASSASSMKLSRIAHVGDDVSTVVREPDQQTKDLFLPFRCFCTRKDIQCKDIVLEDCDVSKALTEYASQASVENLVIGSGSKSGFLRFKMVDIPGTVIKGAPDFCTVFVISKAKVSNMRPATRQAPSTATSTRTPSLAATKALLSPPRQPEPYAYLPPQANNSLRVVNPTMLPEGPNQMNDELEFFQSPFTRGKAANGRSYGEVSLPDLTDISFVSSGRSSIDRLFPSVYDNLDNASRVSSSNMTEFDDGFDLMSVPRRSTDSSIPRKSTDSSIPRKSTDSSINPRPSLTSLEGDMRLSSSTPRATDEIEAEMRRLRLELKQTMEMYSNACKEALTAKQMTKELQRWKVEEQKRYAEARNAQEEAMVIVEREKAKSRAAIEAAEAAKKTAELEAHKRRTAEMKALKEAEEKKKALSMLGKVDVGNRCRKYSIEQIEAATDFFSASLKIGEGGYGPVYKSTLDHTQVAIKVLRPDAVQGRSQFLQEVEVLSCIRHPNMVLLLGACPEYGCLVYEYMANGSLDDHLFRKGNTPVLSWQLRFKIAAEIGTGLLFLHQSKPEPLVHRDLKPGNILLDRNFVSKISDVGLARLVPPSVADTETQYRMTSTAGTFCYIDPEYQQTGMLGVKSDIYSLGIIFLQLITGRPPMGLTHHVERSIEQGTFGEMLDPHVTDWPIEEAMRFAELALRCSELRRKDRPDLGKVVLPELNRLRDLAEETMTPIWVGGSTMNSPNHSQVSMHMGLISNVSG